MLTPMDQLSAMIAATLFLSPTSSGDAYHRWYAGFGILKETFEFNAPSAQGKAI